MHTHARVNGFVSGCRAPQLGGSGRAIHTLPEGELLEKLRELNGTPREVLEHPELMELMLPLLRADFEVFDTYDYSGAPPLGCPVTAFGGLRDPEVGLEELEAWRQQTTGPFRVSMFDGDHFFIHEHEQPLLHELAAELRALTGDKV